MAGLIFSEEESVNGWINRSEKDIKFRKPKNKQKQFYYGPNICVFDVALAIVKFFPVLIRRKKLYTD